jgi:hypothetical protein
VLGVELCPQLQSLSRAAVHSPPLCACANSTCSLHYATVCTQSCLLSSCHLVDPCGFSISIVNHLLTPPPSHTSSPSASSFHRLFAALHLASHSFALVCRHSARPTCSICYPPPPFSLAWSRPNPFGHTSASRPCLRRRSASHLYIPFVVIVIDGSGQTTKETLCKRTRGLRRGGVRLGDRRITC